MKKIIAFIILFSANIYAIVAAVTITRVLPADNSTGIAVLPTISIQFSDYIQANTDSCYINGELVLPTRVTGKTVIFRPNFLVYLTAYKMVIPAGAFKTSTGELTPAYSFSFTTTDRPAPEVRKFDAIVATDGSGNYTSINAAIKAAPEGRTKPWLIFVKKGTYTELVRVPVTKPCIHLIGENADSTILKFAINSDASSKYGPANFPESEGESPVMVINGSDFYSENIKFVNSYGYYNQAGPMALALSSDCDRLALNKCSFYSYQDTWETASSSNSTYRCYARNCYIEGAVDFIYNGGECYFDSCTIGLCRTGTCITAPSHPAGSLYGYIFMNCNIVSSVPGVLRTDNVFGRPWHNNPKVRFINSKLSRDVTIKDAGWIQCMGGLPLIFADYNTIDYKGSPVDLSKRNNYYYTKDSNGNITGECHAQQYCTDREVAAITSQNVLYGSDGWRPDLSMMTLDAPLMESITKSVISWKPNIYAICYMISKNGNFVKFTTDTYYNIEDMSADYAVKAVNDWGGLGNPTIVTSKMIMSVTKPASDANAFVSNGMLVLNNVAANTKVEVYNMGGIKLLTGIASGNSTISLPKENMLIVKVISENKTNVIRCLN